MIVYNKCLFNSWQENSPKNKNYQSAGERIKENHGITKVFRIQCLGTMNVNGKMNGFHPSDDEIFRNLVDRPTHELTDRYRCLSSRSTFVL